MSYFYHFQWSLFLASGEKLLSVPSEWRLFFSIPCNARGLRWILYFFLHLQMFSCFSLFWRVVFLDIELPFLSAILIFHFLCTFVVSDKMLASILLLLQLIYHFFSHCLKNFSFYSHWFQQAGYAVCRYSFTLFVLLVFL